MKKFLFAVVLLASIAACPKVETAPAAPVAVEAPAVVDAGEGEAEAASIVEQK